MGVIKVRVGLKLLPLEKKREDGGEEGVDALHSQVSSPANESWRSSWPGTGAGTAVDGR